MNSISNVSAWTGVIECNLIIERKFIEGLITKQTRSQNTRRKMPASKRRRNIDSGDQISQATPAEVNPFLCDLDDTMDTESDDSTFHQVIKFMELSKQLQRTTDHLHQEELYKSVNKLLSYLDEAKKSQLDESNDNSGGHPSVLNSTHRLISITEVATLLLPWATKKLLRSLYDDGNLLNQHLSIELKTLEACLRRLLWNGDSPSIDVASILTQSILNKLVPLALKICILVPSTGSIKPEVASAAGNCFCLMVDNLYRPTFDLICDSLIPVLRSSVANRTDSKDGPSHTVHLMVLVSTLRLMRTMQAKANPKKAFMVLSRPSVLLSLSDIYYCTKKAFEADKEYALQSEEYVRQILFDGFFNHRYHLDGYRSLNMSISVGEKNTLPSPETKNGSLEDINNNDNERTVSPDHSFNNKFRCYQENLLGTIDDQLSVGNGTTVKESLISSIKVIPLLIKGYILESTKSMDLKHRAKKGTLIRSQSQTGQHRFQFFAHLIRPLLDLLQRMHQTIESYDSLQLALWVSVRESLELVLERDVYIPSDEDKQNKKFSFLQTITTVIGDRFSINHSRNQLEVAEALKTLDVLVRLNHLLLHDRLNEVFTICLSCQASNGSKFLPEAAILFSTILRLYKKLRQLDYIFRSFLKGVENLVGKEDSVGMLSGLRNLLQCRQVDTELAISVQASPMTQIQQIFDDVTAWVQTSCDLLESSRRRMESEHAISVVVAFFAMFVRYVRVEKATSSTIDSICQGIQIDCVDLLLKVASGGSTLFKEGLMLCGWAIELQTRCIFWIGNEGGTVQAEIPQRIIDILASVVSESPLSNKDIASTLNELQFLACHRIKQLHSIIHEQERMELTSGLSGFSSSNYAVEAHKLTAFAVKVACEEREAGLEDANGWGRLAEILVSWTPYSEPSQVDAFLNWFFDVASMIDLAQIESNSPICQPNSMVTVQALVQDANFWEIDEITDRLGAVAISSATASFVQASAYLRGRQAPRCEEWDDLQSLLGQVDWNLVTQDQFMEVINGNIAVDFPNVDNITKVEASFEKCLAKFMLLNGIPDGSWSNASSALDCLWACVVFDQLCRSVAVSCKHNLTLKTLGASRRVCAKLLESLDQDSLNSIAKKEISLGTLIVTTIRSTSILCRNEEFDTISKSMLIAGSKTLAGAITRCCSNHPELHPSLIQGLSRVFGTSSTKYNNSDSLAMTCYARAVLSKLPVLSNDRYGKETDFRKEVVKILHVSMWDRSLMRFFENQGEDSVSSPLESLMLVGDLVRLSNKYDVADEWSTSESKGKLENEAVKLLKNIIDGRSSESEVNAVSFFVACVATTNPSSKELLADHLIGTGATLNRLLEASFCTLVQTMNGNELQTVLDKLQSRAKSAKTRTASELRLFHMIILKISTAEQVTVASRAARFFFSKCLQFLTSRDPCSDATTRSTDVAIASSLIVDMSKNRDLIDIHEHDVALILAHVTSVMASDDGSIVDNDNGGGTPIIDGTTFQPVSVEIYDSCFLLVSFLLQRFAKQLYSSVPCLISTLNTMLCHALYGKLASELDIIDIGQKFSRLCELLLPHKEVYKKHVLSLLLEFVHALKGGGIASGTNRMGGASDGAKNNDDDDVDEEEDTDLLLVRKTSLTPGIYCLLDILQQHELQQLNSMMDDTGKAVFRSVHQHYQKQHVYKGQ